MIKIEIFKNYNENEDFRKVFIKIEIFNSDVQNQDLSTILSKLVISQRYYQNRDFPKTSTKFKIFGNIEQYRDFRIYWPKSKFRIFVAQSAFFEKKINIFQKFQHKARFFWKIWPKSWFSKFFDKIKISYTLTKIEIFENFDQNRWFFKVLTKINNFENFEKHRDASKQKFSKVDNFREFRTNLRFFIKFQKNLDISTIVSKTLTKIKIFRLFLGKSWFF